jgi:hypothetical protein
MKERATPPFGWPLLERVSAGVAPFPHASLAAPADKLLRWAGASRRFEWLLPKRDSAGVAPFPHASLAAPADKLLRWAGASRRFEWLLPKRDSAGVAPFPHASLAAPADFLFGGRLRIQATPGSTTRFPFRSFCRMAGVANCAGNRREKRLTQQSRVGKAERCAGGLRTKRGRALEIHEILRPHATTGRVGAEDQEGCTRGVVRLETTPRSRQTGAAQRLKRNKLLLVALSQGADEGDDVVNLLATETLDGAHFANTLGDVFLQLGIALGLNFL